MALGSTQPLTEMSTRSIPGVKGGQCVRLTTYHHPEPLSQNLGTLTSWNPLGPSGPVMGLLYLFYFCKGQKRANKTPNLIYLTIIGKGKGKEVPLQAQKGPEGSRKLRFPDFVTTAQDGGKVVSLTHRPPLPAGYTPGTHFC